MQQQIAELQKTLRRVRGRRRKYKELFLEATRERDAAAAEARSLRGRVKALAEYSAFLESLEAERGGNAARPTRLRVEVDLDTKGEINTSAEVIGEVRLGDAAKPDEVEPPEAV